MRKEKYYSGQGISELKSEYLYSNSFAEGIDEIEGQEEFKELRQKILRLIKKYFPTLSAKYQPPELELIYQNYTYICSLVESNDYKQINLAGREFLFTAAVRLIDNFIDEVYWPEVVMQEKDENGKQTAYRTMEKFLHEAQEIIAPYDPYMPQEIKELPLIELRLALHPDQKTFDNEIENYFERKSFNIAYLRHLVHREQSQSEELWTEKERSQNHLVAAWDISRDLQSINREKSDFSIFKHIEQHDLNPERLVYLLIKVIKQTSPTIFALYKAYDKPMEYNNDSWEQIEYAFNNDNLTQQNKFFIRCCLQALYYLEENLTNSKAENPIETV